MALRLKKDIKKSSYYVWFLGAQESRGLRGDEYALPAIDVLERRSRDLEPFKVTLQVSHKGLKIIQNVAPKGKQQTIKHFIPHGSITSAVVQGDVVACVLLLFNPITGCPIHVHAYRCDSERTAQMLCSHLQALIDRPENQKKFAHIEKKLQSKGALPAKKVPDSSLGSEVSTRESESGSSEERCVANLYDSLAAELKQKLSTGKSPILLPPRDYDTVHRQKGNLSGIDTRRCLNQNIVGVNARRKMESSGGSSGIGSDMAPSPDQEYPRQQPDNHSTSEEDWAESTAYMMHEAYEVTPVRRALSPRREPPFEPPASFRDEPAMFQKHYREQNFREQVNHNQNAYRENGYQRKCRDEPSKYRDESSKYRDEQSKYHKETRKYSDEQSKYRDEPSKYRDGASKYRDGANKYRDEASKYRDESRKHRDEQVKYREDEYREEPSVHREKVYRDDDRCYRQGSTERTPKFDSYADKIDKYVESKEKYEEERYKRHHDQKLNKSMDLLDGGRASAERRLEERRTPKIQRGISEGNLKVADSSPKDRFNNAKEKFKNLERERLKTELEKHIQMRRHALERNERQHSPDERRREVHLRNRSSERPRDLSARRTEPIRLDDIPVERQLPRVGRKAEPRRYEFGTEDYFDQKPRRELDRRIEEDIVEPVVEDRRREWSDRRHRNFGLMEEQRQSYAEPEFYQRSYRDHLADREPNKFRHSYAEPIPRGRLGMAALRY